MPPVSGGIVVSGVRRLSIRFCLPETDGDADRMPA